MLGKDSKGKMAVMNKCVPTASTDIKRQRLGYKPVTEELRGSKSGGS